MPPLPRRGEPICSVLSLLSALRREDTLGLGSTEAVGSRAGFNPGFKSFAASASSA